MSDSSGHGAPGGWERRAADFASEVQRWLIRASARSMRDEVGDQVRKALGGRPGRAPGADDVWAAATSEPPGAQDEPPECEWCPVCRAARRISRTRQGAGGGQAGAGPRLGDAADVMAAAVREALAGLDSLLSYRPGSDQPGEPPDEPDHRG